MSHARFTPELIDQLRSHVIAHNESVVSMRVNLGRLKKAVQDNWRGPDPQAKGLRAVARLLGELRKADPGFEEGEHPRDGRGRFTAGSGTAKPAGGQRQLYADTQSRKDHEQLREDNAGYAAQQQQVIPETRYTELYPVAGYAAGVAVGAAAGAAPVTTSRIAGAVGRGAGKLAGIATAPVTAGLANAATAVEEKVRRLGGRPARSQTDYWTARAQLATGMRNAVSNRVARTVKGAADLANAPGAFMGRKAAADVAARGLTARAKFSRLARGHLAGATVGAILPGMLAAEGIKSSMEAVGPMLNAAFPRRVDKSTGANEMHAEIAAAEEALAKVSLTSLTGGARRIGGAALSSLKGMIPKRAAPAAAVAQAPKRAAEQGRFDRLGRIAANAAIQRANPITTAGHVIGAAGGAVAMGAAAAGVAHVGQRIYYRDEDGKFASKGNAVVTGTAAATAAALGAAAALLATRRSNRTLARNLAEKHIASRASILDSAKERYAAHAERKGGAAAKKAKKEADAQFEGWKAAADSNDPVTWTHWAIDRRADEMIDDLFADTKGFRNAHPESRASALPGMKAERSVIQHATDAPTQAKLKALDTEIAEIEGAVAARKGALANHEATVKAWEAGGSKGAKPKAPESWYVAARNDRAAGKADWLRHLHPSQRVKVEKILETAEKAKADYAGKVTAARNAPKEASEKLAEHTGKVAELDAKIAETETRRSALNTQRQALGTSKVPEDAATRSQLANDIVDLDTAKVALVAERDAAKSLADAETSRLAQAKAALKNLQPTDESKPAFPRARDPFDNKKFIPAKPTDAELAATHERILTRLKGGSDTRKTKFAEGGERDASFIAEATLRALRSRGEAPTGAVGRSIGHVSAVVGPRMASLRAEAAKVGGVVTAAMGPAGGKAVEYATLAKERAVSWATDAAKFAWKNPATIARYAVPPAVLFGFAEIADDGSMNMSLLRRGKDKDKSPVDLVRERAKPVYKIFNPGADNQTIIVGMAVEQPDGRKIMVHGTKTVGNGRSQPILGGADLDDVLRNARNGGGSGNNANRPKPTFGDPSQRQKWEKAAADAKSQGKLATFGEGEDAFDYRSDRSVFGQEGAQVRDALASDATAARNRGGLKGGEWYQHAAKIFDGAGSELLVPQWREDLIMGGGKDRPGLLHSADAARIQAAIDTGERPKFAAALGQLVQNAPPWKDGQDRQLRRVVRVIDAMASRRNAALELTSQEVDSLYRKIADKRMGGDASPAPAAAAASTPPFEPPHSQTGGQRAAASSDASARIRVKHLEAVTMEAAKAFDTHYADPAHEELVREAFERKAEQLARQGRVNTDDADAYYRKVAEQTLKSLEANRAKKSAQIGALRKAEGDAFARLAKAAEREAPAKREAPQAQRRGLPGDAPRHSSRGMAGELSGPPREPGSSRPGMPSRGMAGELAERRSATRHQPAGSDRGGEFAPGRAGGAAPSRRPAPQQQQAQEPTSYFEPQRFLGTVGGALASQAGWEMASKVLPGPLKTAAIGGRLISRMARYLGNGAGKMAIAGATGIAGQLGGEALGAKAYRGEAPEIVERERGLEEEVARFGGSHVGESMISQLGGKSFGGRLLAGTAGQLGGEELAAAAHEVISRRFGRA